MNKKLLIRAAAALAVRGGLWFFFSPSEDAGESASGPAMEFSDSELHELENGQIVWKLNVGHAALDADKNTCALPMWTAISEMKTWSSR